MERGRIQRLPKFFEYPLLSQERVKLRTSTFVCTFLVSIGTKSITNFWKSCRLQLFRAPIYWAHRAVLFAIAQLSCYYYYWSYNLTHLGRHVDCWDMLPVNNCNLSCFCMMSAVPDDYYDHCLQFCTLSYVVISWQFNSLLPRLIPGIIYLPLFALLYIKIPCK